jgi:hypothetical protein
LCSVLVNEKREVKKGKRKRGRGKKGKEKNSKRIVLK